MNREQTWTETPTVFAVGRRRFILPPAGRGEELRLHLASHGVRAALGRDARSGQEQLELEDGLDTQSVQALLDHWER